MDQKFETSRFLVSSFLVPSYSISFLDAAFSHLKHSIMLTKLNFSEHRKNVLSAIKDHLTDFEPGYASKLRFYSIIRKHPLEVLVLGREYSQKQSDTLIKNWLKEAIGSSEYLNN